MPGIEALLSVREVATRLGVSVSFVHRLIRDDRLRASRSSIGYLIDPDDFDRFAAERSARGRAA